MASEDVTADTRASFIRQRRFLFGTSIAILCYEYLGLSVQQINLLGTSASVANPEHLAVVLLVIHAWAVYRYWTHFQELAPWRPFRDSRLERWRQLLTPSNWAKRRKEGDEFAQFWTQNAAELEGLREKNQIEKGARAKDAHLAQVGGGTVSTLREEWNIPFYSEKRQGQVGYVTLGVAVGKWRARRTLLQSWIVMLVNRTFFSEYIVPIGLAVIAVIAYATSWFEFFVRP
jgi:hypothetical protein